MFDHHQRRATACAAVRNVIMGAAFVPPMRTNGPFSPRVGSVGEDVGLGVAVERDASGLEQVALGDPVGVPLGVLVTHEREVAQYAARLVAFRDGRIRVDQPIVDRHDAGADLIRLHAEPEFSGADHGERRAV